MGTLWELFGNMMGVLVWRETKRVRLAAESVVAVSRVCALPSFVDLKEHTLEEQLQLVRRLRDEPVYMIRFDGFLRVLEKEFFENGLWEEAGASSSWASGGKMGDWRRRRRSSRKEEEEVEK
jgi:hypothetical protein